jgi:hypothetical protein
MTNRVSVEGWFIDSKLSKETCNVSGKLSLIDGQRGHLGLSS